MSNEIRATDSGSEILVVDDNADNLKLLADLLMSEGYRVRPTTDPRLALEAAFSYPPSMILLDVKMPGMDGFEVCQRLREEPRTADIPVIFVSAVQETRDRVRGFELGAVDFISKPIQRQEVLARVGTHLELDRMRKNLTELVEEKTRQLQLDEKRFSALYELSQMRSMPEEQLSALALEKAVNLTQSEVGYLHFIDVDQENISFYQWSEETLKQCNAEPASHHPLSTAGIWADCVRQQRPVIHNDYPNITDKPGLPEGHSPLKRHMSVPIYDGGKVVAVIGVGNKQAPYDEADARQLNLFGGNMWSVVSRRRSDEQVQSSLVQAIQSIALILEQRDPYTAGHQRRVAELACAIAGEMGLSQAAIEGIRMGGIVHDIGKINVPIEILVRPGKLTEHEFSIIQAHPDVGFNILKDIDFPWPVADMVHQHHERLDGSGYPLGLKDDEICIEARILAVADVVEAMSSHRPYRPGLGIDAALEVIQNDSGTKFDAEVVKICTRLFTEKNYEFDTTG